MTSVARTITTPIAIPPAIPAFAPVDNPGFEEEDGDGVAMAGLLANIVVLLGNSRFLIILDSEVTERWFVSDRDRVGKASC